MPKNKTTLVIDPHPVLTAVAGGTKDFLRGLCRKAVRQAQFVKAAREHGNSTINVLGAVRVHVLKPGQELPKPPTNTEQHV